MKMLTIMTSRKAWPIWLLSAGLVLTWVPARSRGEDQPPADSAAPQDEPEKAATTEKPAAASGGRAELADLKTLLAIAMQNNPDILVCMADLDEADAEASQILLDVARKVVAAKGAIRAQQELVKVTLVRVRSARASWEQLQAEKIKLAALEADLPYLLGMTARLPLPEEDTTAASGEPDTAAAKSDDEISQKTSTEALLLKAIEHNPDFKVAKAKLKGVDAVLRRTRLDVARKVMTSQASVRYWRLRTAGLQNAKDKVKGSISEQQMAEALASLAAAEADLSYVLGQMPSDKPEGK
jgi:hypothetical protein